MKRIRTLLALASWGLGAIAIHAADQPATAPQGTELATRLQEINERLKLTDEQKAQITPILQQEIADLKVVRDDTSLSRAKKLRRAKEITDAAGGQIRALLTPEQQKEYDVLRDEMREKLKARVKDRQSVEN